MKSLDFGMHASLYTIIHINSTAPSLCPLSTLSMAIRVNLLANFRISDSI